MGKDVLLVVAIGLSLVSIGHIIDLSLKKKEVRKLHDMFLLWANALSDTPLLQWQVKVISFGFKLIHFVYIKVGVFMTRVAEISESITLFECTFSKECSVQAYSSEVDKIFPFIYVTLHSVFFGLVATVMLAFFVRNREHELMYVMGLTIFITLIYYLIVIGLLVNNKFLRRTTKDTTSVFLLACPIISYLWTIVAIETSYLLAPTNSTNEYLVNLERYKAQPILLASVKFPFDCMTIYITYFLLKYVLKYGKYISVASFIDIVTSFVLSFITYIILIFIGKNDKYISYSDFYQNLHLLPLSFTVFIPVCTYMFVLLFLSFCKPIMWISSRIFSAIGERDESVFKQFATVIAALMGLIKAIYEYFKP
jgi:hypothetical protein